MKFLHIIIIILSLCCIKTTLPQTVAGPITLVVYGNQISTLSPATWDPSIYGLCINPLNGNLAVGDKLQNRIVSINNGDGAVTSLTTLTGLTPSTFWSVMGIVRGQSNIFFVSDSKNNRILKFNLGTYQLSVYGSPPSNLSPATYNNPTALTFHTVTGDLYAADYYNNRIVKILTNNGAISQYGTGVSALSPNAYNWPSGLAMDSANTILYVSDQGNNRIIKIAAAGTASLYATGVSTLTPSTLSSPQGNKYCF